MPVPATQEDEAQVRSSPEPRAVPPHFGPSPDTMARRLGDEIVLVQLKTDRIYVLNRTAARLWELLSAGQQRAEIERQARREFDVDEIEVARALDELLASLISESLITPHDGP